jgi:hypothetical protein
MMRPSPSSAISVVVRARGPRIPLLVFPFLVCILLLTTIARAAGPEDDRLFAHGTDQMYWVAKVSPAAADSSGSAAGKSVHTVIQSRTAGGQRWHLLSRLDARVVGMTDRSESVAVLLDSGDWMLLWSGGGTVGKPLPATKSNNSTAGKTLLLALAGTPETIWAVGRGNIDALPIATPAPTPATSTSAPTPAPSAASADRADLPRGMAGTFGASTAAAATSEPSAQSSSSAGRQSLGLFEFSGNRWLLRARISEEFDADTPDDL